MVTLQIYILTLISIGVVSKIPHIEERSYFDLAPPLGGDYIRNYAPLPKNRWTCPMCETIFGTIMFQIRYSNETQEAIRDRFLHLRYIFRLWGTVRLGRYGVPMPSESVFSTLIERLTPTIYFIFKNRPQLTAKAFCGYCLEFLGCHTNDPYLYWNIQVPNKHLGGVVPFDSKANILQTVNRSESSSRKMVLAKILHLADLHVDLSYQTDSEAFCQNSVLCCHNSSKSQHVPILWFWFASDRSKKAGYFGDSNQCDAPLRLLELTLQHLVKKHPDIEIMYMTGDLVPRNIHIGTKPDNIQVIHKASNLIHKYFPSTIVVPAIGNHETHPVNLFSPDDVPQDINTMWIYNVTLEAWRHWITEPEQKKTFLRGGYYSMEFKTKNLKIIVLNTNLCYGINIWGLYKVKDPAGQLKWLIKELEKAEEKHQFVHIVGHIAPGRGCNKMWSRNFYNIVLRFHHIIKAQFYGHTHFDQLQLFYGATGEPISSIFISPALTPYRRSFSVNPGYKLFYAHSGSDSDSDDQQNLVTADVDGEGATWDIYNYATYIFDLDEANKTPQVPPKWYQLYNATFAYNLNDTTVQSLGKLVEGMAANRSLFDIYFQHSRKSGPTEKYMSSRELQLQVLCDIVTPYSMHMQECQWIYNLADAADSKA